jgi:hypothetical protein
MRPLADQRIDERQQEAKICLFNNFAAVEGGLDGLRRRRIANPLRAIPSPRSA